MVYKCILDSFRMFTWVYINSMIVKINQIYTFTLKPQDCLRDGKPCERWLKYHPQFAELAQTEDITRFPCDWLQKRGYKVQNNQ